MLEIFHDCTGALRGKKISKELAWQADAENLAVKIFFHLGSSFQLQTGTSLPPISGVTPNYVDFPSIAILTRAALETYLCFNFIYVKPSTMKEKAFHHDIWELGGFLERQKFTATTAEGRQKIQEEKEVIKELKEKIGSNPIFDTLSDPRKKDAIKGKWRLGKQWVDIAEASGVHTKYFVGLYAYLSSFSHSGNLGILQLSQARNKQQQESLSNIYTSINLTLMSHFIIAYCRFFPEAQEFLDSHIEEKNFVQIFLVTAEDWEQLINKA